MTNTWCMKLTTAILASAAASAAFAGPFYCRYDAESTFPEEEGWERHWNDPDGQIERSVEGGVLHLDTSASTHIHDTYIMPNPAIQASPGETLIVKWRMHTLDSQPVDVISDVGVLIVNENRAYANILLGPSLVYEAGGPQPEQTYPIAPGEWHEYKFVTSDMSTYSMYVDDVLAFESGFHGWSGTPGPFIAFGDMWYGLRSVSEWDYIEIGVIPEPAGLTLGLVLTSMSLRRR